MSGAAYYCANLTGKFLNLELLYLLRPTATPPPTRPPTTSQMVSRKTLCAESLPRQVHEPFTCAVSLATAPGTAMLHSRLPHLGSILSSQAQSQSLPQSTCNSAQSLSHRLCESAPDARPDTLCNISPARHLSCF